MGFNAMKNYLLVTCLAFSFSACEAENIGFKSMDSAEKEFNERQAKERVAYMTLEALFPDHRVRALAEAAGKGKGQVVEGLVSQGVAVNSRGTKGATPLFWAMRNIEGFEQLLDLGADPNLIFDGSSVMHWAARNDDLDFLQKVLKHEGDPNLIAGKFSETPIFKTIGVIGSDNEPAMILLLDSGANINAKTGGKKVFGLSMGGKTPVMIAADLARFDIVLTLLVRGADYSLKDDSGRDLMARIASMKGRFSPDSEQEEYLEKVIQEIKGSDKK
jgi:ankyrin repeat protein